jgi:MOSC domain-containing protein YiiM
MLSVEELAAIANALHVSKVFPKDLGGNILVSGIPSLTTLPPNTVYSLGSALLLSAGENLPCRLGGEATAERYGDPSLATAFSQSALGLRGQVGSVLEPGVVMIRDSIRVYPPDFFR